MTQILILGYIRASSSVVTLTNQRKPRTDGYIPSEKSEANVYDLVN